MRMRLAFFLLATVVALTACVPRTQIPPGVPSVLASLPPECLAYYEANGPDGFWFGGFHGAKEVRSIFGLADDREVLQDTFRRQCFPDERSCRRWLYDLQSEYTARVYTATCRRGLPA